MRSLVFIIVLINLKINISLLENPSPNYENLVQDLEKRLSVQKALNARLRSRLTETEEDDRIRRASTCRPIVFQAHLQNSINPIGYNQIVTYDHIVTNEGSAYDTLTGMFEATSSGLYQFIATMWSNDGYNIDFEIMLNGAGVCAGRTTTTNQSMGVCSAILQVPEGGRVFVRHKSNNGNYAKGDNYAVFAGHLIM